MPIKFSVYLDIVRFLAALAVFIGHAAGMNWTGGFLWQVAAYADTCVIVFFVLSGFVIAYVANEKEYTLGVYFASRASRIWSVAIPALFLTFVIDSVGVRVAPEIYLGQPWYAEDRPVLRYVASLFMLQEVWHLKLVPGINAPFWSLSFEAFYYLAFGCVFYLKASYRWVIATLLMLIAGPLIAALFPIWLLGYIAYRQTKYKNHSYRVSLLFFLVGIFLLGLSPLIRSLDSTGFQILGDAVIGRYIDAFAFYLNLLGAYGLSRYGGQLNRRLCVLISKIAATTFVLYLFHRPLIQFFSYIGPEDPASATRRALVILGTLTVIFLAYPACELLRGFMRKRFLGLIPAGGQAHLSPKPAI